MPEQPVHRREDEETYQQIKMKINKGENTYETHRQSRSGRLQCRN